MLTPSYLLHATEPAEEIAEKLHIDIIKRIVERILIRFDRNDDYILTALDKWQLETLREAGFLLEEIQKEIAAATGLMQTEIAQAMEDAGVKALEYDDAIYQAAGLEPVPLTQSPHMVRLMQDTYEQTMGEWKNFTNISKRAVHDLFVDACDTAYMQAMSGAISSRQAVREALETIVEGGVYVKYPGGRTDTIETATARAVRTGISQASGRIQIARMDDMEWDIVLTSAHIGARPGDGGANGTNHIWWQGRFFSRSGKNKKFPSFVESTGYGTITGLCGAGCRHSFGPGDGKNNPFDTKYINFADQRKAYETEQRQRTLERRIRNTKREVMTLDTARTAAQGSFKDVFENDYQRKAALLQKQNAAYNQYCKENGLKKQSERIAIAKWDRSQAARARAAAKRYNEDKE